MKTSYAEEELLMTLVPRLEAEGYRVYRDPSREQLPEFMGSYIPDLIALGEGKKSLAIEVKSTGQSKTQSDALATIKQRFKGRTDWDLRVYYLPRDTPVLAISDIAKIEEHVSQAEVLLDEGRNAAALMISFAAFEAVGRNLLPSEMRRPQTPGRVLSLLASGGDITPTEADIVRRLIDARNRFIHGELAVSVTADDVRTFVGTIRKLLLIAANHGHGSNEAP